MLRSFASFKTAPLRRAALAGALALVATATVVASAAPAAAFNMRPHMGFGMGHMGFNHHRFFFGAPAFFPGYYDDYAGYDVCLRRVWGPYGWRVVNVCY